MSPRLALLLAAAWARPPCAVDAMAPVLQGAVSAATLSEAGGAPTCEAIVGVRDLTLPTRSALAGIEQLSNLESLSLPAVDGGLGPLAGCPKLRELSLGVPGLDHPNEVSELTPLAGLTELRVLRVPNAQLQRLDPLAGLARLQVLDVSDNPIADLTPLGGLRGLVELSVRGDPVTDLSPLSGLSQLRVLDLSHTKAQDLRPLSTLVALETLALAGAPVADLRPLQDLPLGLLDLCGTPADRRADPLLAAGNDAVVRSLRGRGAQVQIGGACGF